MADDLSWCAIIGRQAATVQGSLKDTATLSAVLMVKHIIKEIDNKIVDYAIAQNRYKAQNESELVLVSTTRIDTLTLLRDQLTSMIGSGN